MEEVVLGLGFATGLSLGAWNYAQGNSQQGGLRDTADSQHNDSGGGGSGNGGSSAPGLPHSNSSGSALLVPPPNDSLLLRHHSPAAGLIVGWNTVGTYFHIP